VTGTLCEAQVKYMNDKLSLSLIDNSFDYLESAIKYANGTENRDWKYALLNLASAIELMMKAVLEQEHWSLLFETIDNASKEALTQGDFKSVNFVKAVERIKCIVGVNFSPTENKYLEKIRTKRNKITHFSAELHIEEVKSIVAKGIGLFIKLYRQAVTELNPNQIADYFINANYLCLIFYN